MSAEGALSGQPVVSEELSDRDRAVLAFERQWWKYAGAKEQAIRELFDMSATRYYQVLNALLDRPEALAADEGVSLRTAAQMIGVGRVAEAHRTRGLYP